MNTPRRGRSVTPLQIDQKIGNWTIIDPEYSRIPGGYVAALCRCKCGAEKEVAATRLRSGRSTQCKSCSAKSTAHVRIPKRTKHGNASNYKKSPEYVAWQAMKHRCSNSNGRRFSDYGGRGITVCEKWRNDFEAFLKDVGPRPGPGYSIDRYPNNDGNYEPGNVRWATTAQQARNKRGIHRITINNETKTLADWTKVYGISLGAVFGRLRRGMDVIDAITIPPGHLPRNKRTHQA